MDEADEAALRQARERLADDAHVAKLVLAVVPRSSGADLLPEDDGRGALALAHLGTERLPVAVGAPDAGGVTGTLRGDPEREPVDPPIGFARRDVDRARDRRITAMPGHAVLAGSGLDRRDDLGGDAGVDVGALGLRIALGHREDLCDGPGEPLSPITPVSNDPGLPLSLTRGAWLRLRRRMPVKQALERGASGFRSDCDSHAVQTSRPLILPANISRQCQRRVLNRRPNSASLKPQGRVHPPSSREM